MHVPSEFVLKLVLDSVVDGHEIKLISMNKSNCESSKEQGACQQHAHRMYRACTPVENMHDNRIVMHACCVHTTCTPHVCCMFSRMTIITVLCMPEYSQLFNL